MPALLVKDLKQLLRRWEDLENFCKPDQDIQ